MRDVFVVCWHSYGRLLRTISCGVMLAFLRTLCWYFCGRYVGIFADIMLVFLWFAGIQLMQKNLPGGVLTIVEKLGKFSMVLIVL